MRELICRAKSYIIFVLAILLVLGGSAYKKHLVNDISMQHPEKRWSGGEIPSGYIAAYFGEGEGLTEDTVNGFKESYDNSLKQDSFEIPENKRLYVEAYSTEGKLEASKELSGGNVSVNVTAIGGDYFRIHSMELLYGSYISGSDIMKDGVVLDENAAWNLYGSADIVGKHIYINNDFYYITGVVKLHGSKISKKTYGNRSRIFMSYESYRKYEPEALINCYEVLYPDVINNYAMNNVNENLGIQNGLGDSGENVTDERNIEVVNMSTRFKIPALWKVITSYGERSTRTMAIKYPYFENECRITEDYASLTLIWNAVFLIVAAAAIIPKCVMAWKKCSAWVKGAWYKKFGRRY